MYLTKKLLESGEGARSPLVRSAMEQAGDKHRVEGLKKFLVSAGSCVITFDDAANYGLRVLRKKYSFCRGSVVFAFVEPKLFNNFEPIKNTLKLQLSLLRNGIIGIRKRSVE